MTRFRIEELKQGKSYYTVAGDTGIRRKTLMALDKGEAIECRMVYISALTKYFGVEANALIETSDVELPLGFVDKSKSTKGDGESRKKRVQ